MNRIRGWLGYGCIGILVAGLFAAVPFWTLGLTLDQATVAAAIIFPLVLIAYAFAIWRESRRGGPSS